MTWSKQRFYRTAELSETDRGYRVLLDGRAMRTPAGADLLLPTQALAQAVVEEWLAQGDVIRPETLPATRLAATAIDRISANRGALIDQLVRSADFDLLFYRAAHPPDLARRQDRCWQPLLDWAAGRCGITFTVTRGVMPVRQPDDVAQALAALVERLEDMELTAVASVAQATGSLIIALALAAERIDAETACQAALLDESYQIERWGLVDESMARRQRIEDEIVFAAKFIAWCRHGGRDYSGADRREGHLH